MFWLLFFGKYSLCSNLPILFLFILSHPEVHLKIVNNLHLFWKPLIMTFFPWILFVFIVILECNIVMPESLYLPPPSPTFFMTSSSSFAWRCLLCDQSFSWIFSYTISPNESNENKEAKTSKTMSVGGNLTVVWIFHFSLSSISSMPMQTIKKVILISHKCH